LFFQKLTILFYFIRLIYDKRLIPDEMKEPMNYESPKPEVVDRVTMDDIKRFFVNYVFSDQLGKIANAHLAKADSFDVGAAHGECIRLAQLHSQAVDFPKTGIPAIIPPELRAKQFPDFMEKPDKPTYRSKKVLGELYRSIKEEEYEPYTDSEFDESLRVDGYEKYLENARILKAEYDLNVKGLMNQFGVMTEFEVTSGYIVNTITKVDKKKPRDIVKSVMDAFIPIRKCYRKKFEEEFGDETNAFTQKAKESKAFAWYYVTYHPSELSELGDENMISFPWIVYDILCDIAIKNNSRTNVVNRPQPIHIVNKIQPIESTQTNNATNNNNAINNGNANNNGNNSNNGNNGNNDNNDNNDNNGNNGDGSAHDAHDFFLRHARYNQADTPGNGTRFPSENIDDNIDDDIENLKRLIKV
jgi:RNA-dependent RNA polymerase